jgi:hypothetical protein
MATKQIRDKDSASPASPAPQQEPAAPSASKRREHGLVSKPPAQNEHKTRQRNATFTVELLIGADGEVRKTSVAHVQSGDKELQTLCRGWDAAQLVNYIVQHSGMRMPSPQTEKHEPKPDACMRPVLPKLSGEPRLRELDIAPAGAHQPITIVPHDQPFQVRLELDLADVAMPDGQPINYTATVLARRLGTGAREKLAERHGQIPETATLTVDVPANRLPGGLYKLVTLVDITLTSDTAKPQPIQTTKLKSGMLRIY